MGSVRFDRYAALVAVLSVILLGPAARAQEEAVARRPWGPEQAAGKPDTVEAGDGPTAWAALLPDAASISRRILPTLKNARFSPENIAD